jgi:hypothetical protein
MTSLKEMSKVNHLLNLNSSNNLIKKVQVKEEALWNLNKNKSMIMLLAIHLLLIFLMPKSLKNYIDDLSSILSYFFFIYLLS